VFSLVLWSLLRAAASGSSGGVGLKQWLLGLALATCLLIVVAITSSLAGDNSAYVGVFSLLQQAIHLWELVLLGGCLLQLQGYIAS